jgi:hypothetical protein
VISFCLLSFVHFSVLFMNDVTSFFEKKQFQN